MKVSDFVQQTNFPIGETYIVRYICKRSMQKKQGCVISIYPIETESSSFEVVTTTGTGFVKSEDEIYTAQEYREAGF